MKTTLKLWGALALSMVVSASAFAKHRYKYYLDPNRAEEILGGIQYSSTSKDQWLGILGPKKNLSYTVQPGDNLWDISQKTIGDPWHWRKLWAVNPTLTNPHEINVGQVLSYYRELASDGRVEIPLVKLVPAKPGAISDLDSDSFVNPEMKNQYRPPFYVVSEDSIVGEVVGSFEEREWLSDHDDLFIRLDNGETVPAGTKFSVVRVDRQIEDGTVEGKPFLGMLVRLVGEVQITQPTDKLSKGHLVRHMEILKRGDKIIALRPPIKALAVFNPPEELKARIVMGEVDEAKFFGQGQIVLLNKGEVDGMKEGFLFRVTQDMDQNTHSTNDVNPDFKAEIQVIATGPLSSIGLILRNRDPLLIGDTLVAAQLFKDPPPPPRMEAGEIELD